LPGEIDRGHQALRLQSRRHVDGLGDKFGAPGREKGLVKEPADLYRLSPAQWAGLERMAEKSARNILDALATAKQPTG
jgi:DNA ligase (NAD+)